MIKRTDEEIQRYMTGVLMEDLTLDEMYFYTLLVHKAMNYDWDVPYLYDYDFCPDQGYTLLSVKRLADILGKQVPECERHMGTLMCKGIISADTEESVIDLSQDLDGVCGRYNRIYYVNPFLFKPCEDIIVEYVGPFLFAKYAKVNAQYCGATLPDDLTRHEDEESQFDYDDEDKEIEWENEY